MNKNPKLGGLILPQSPGGRDKMSKKDIFCFQQLLSVPKSKESQVVTSLEVAPRSFDCAAQIIPDDVTDNKCGGAISYITLSKSVFQV